MDSEPFESVGIMADLRAAEGDVDDGNQTPRAAQRAEQPVSTGLTQNLQGVTPVEAQLARLGGDVVAQRSYISDIKPQTKQELNVLFLIKLTLNIRNCLLKLY